MPSSGKKTLQLQHVGGKQKKIEQTSSKIESTNNLFYPGDGVFAC